MNHRILERTIYRLEVDSAIDAHCVIYLIDKALKPFDKEIKRQESESFRCEFTIKDLKQRRVALIEYKKELIESFNLESEWVQSQIKEDFERFY